MRSDAELRMKVIVLAVVGASGCAGNKPPLLPAFSVAAAMDEPRMPVSAPVRVELPAIQNTCDVEPGQTAPIAWVNEATWTGGERSSIEVHGDCILGWRADGEYHVRVDPSIVLGLLASIPQGRVASRARDAAMTTVRVTTMDRDDESRFPNGTAGGEFAAKGPGTTPAFRALAEKLRAVEEVVWKNPWRVVRAQVLPPDGAVPLNTATPLKVAMVNPGHQSVTIKRGRNVFILWAQEAGCSTRCERTRISRTGATAIDVELPPGREREVEVTAWLRTAGPVDIYATIDGIDQGAEPFWFAGTVASPPVTIQVK